MNNKRLVSFAGGFIPLLIVFALLISAVFMFPGFGAFFLADGNILLGVASQSAAGTTAGRQALVCSAVHGPLLSIAAASVSFFTSDPEIIGHSASALIFASVLFVLTGSLQWLLVGRTRDLIITALAMSAAFLCGTAQWCWVLSGAASIIAGALLRNRYRKRICAVLVLGLLPAVYAALVWTLMNWLIMSDPLFFLKPFDRFRINAMHMFSPSSHDGSARNNCDICAAAGFSPIAAEDADSVISAVEKHVGPAMPHCKVFVTDFTGLGLLRNNTENKLFVPVMDMHIGMSRREYHNQSLYVLVHSPEGPGRLESMRWKAPDFYEFGSSRTLLALEIPPWKLYEITRYIKNGTGDVERPSAMQQESPELKPASGE